MLSSEAGWYLWQVFRSGDVQLAVYYGVLGTKYVMCKGNEYTTRYKGND